MLILAQVGLTTNVVKDFMVVVVAYNLVRFLDFANISYTLQCVSFFFVSYGSFRSLLIYNRSLYCLSFCGSGSFYSSSLLLSFQQFIDHIIYKKANVVKKHVRYHVYVLKFVVVLDRQCLQHQW